MVRAYFGAKKRRSLSGRPTTHHGVLSIESECSGPSFEVYKTSRRLYFATLSDVALDSGSDS